MLEEIYNITVSFALLGIKLVNFYNKKVITETLTQYGDIYGILQCHWLKMYICIYSD